MGSTDSSLQGRGTTTEPFTVRANGYFDLPVKGSGSSIPARAPEPTTFPPQTKSGSSSARVVDYYSFPFHTKGSSYTVIGMNSSSFGHNSSNISSTTKGKPSGVIAFHSSAQWKAHFDAAKNTDKLMVIDFTATWCGPCRSMDAVINDFAAKYTNVEFIKIDVDELHDVAMKYQVVTMPTFLLMKKGNVVDKVVGANKDQLKAKIELHLIS